MDSMVLTRALRDLVRTLEDCKGPNVLTVVLRGFVITIASLTGPLEALNGILVRNRAPMVITRGLSNIVRTLGSLEALPGSLATL